jgi:hypothetical protein
VWKPVRLLQLSLLLQSKPKSKIPNVSELLLKDLRRK